MDPRASASLASLNFSHVEKLLTARGEDDLLAAAEPLAKERGARARAHRGRGDIIIAVELPLDVLRQIDAHVGRRVAFPRATICMV